MRKYENVWEIMRKNENVWECLQNYEKVCENKKVWKYEKALESDIKYDHEVWG